MWKVKDWKWQVLFEYYVNQKQSNIIEAHSSQDVKNSIF